MVSPISYYVGNYTSNKNVGNSSSYHIENATAHFIPLRIVFKYFFELPNIFNVTVENIKKMKMSSSNICDFFQSPLWLHILNFYPNKMVLPVFLFYDDFEINNPLGSHSGIHKLGGTYVSIPALPIQYQSHLENIFFSILCHSCDRNLFGNRAIFNILLQELAYLENEGITVVVGGKKHQLYFVLALIVGDNLAVNGILGFTESFKANYFCRLCKASKEQCQNLCTSVSDFQRIKENYDRDVIASNVSNTGIKEPCMWNDLSSFNVTENLTVDIMHDLYEGICRYELGAILYAFIINEKFFSLQLLNERIKFCKYVVNETNRPTLIKMEQIRKKYIIMSSSEMKCLIRYLGLIIGNKVPHNNAFWELFLLLKKIISLSSSQVTNPSTCTLLKSVIEEHHNLYLELFNESFKPKHHLITHYPEVMLNIGPLRGISAIRFEAKHRHFKRIAAATSSRVNITLTIAKKNQLQLSERLLSRRGFPETIIFGPVIDVDCFMWVKVNGIKYIVKKTVLLTNVDEPLPQFSRFETIERDENNELLFSLKIMENIGYYFHVDAFEIKESTNAEKIKVRFSQLLNIFPASDVLNFANTNEKFILLY